MANTSLPDPPLRATERRNPLSHDIDLMTAHQLVDLFITEDRRVPLAVADARSAITAVVDAVEQSFRSGGRLFYIGAGTSGRLGVLDASECPPTFGTDPSMVQGIIAGGAVALTNAVEGAEDDRDAGRRELVARRLSATDTVVGIAASGTTPFVHGGLDHAASVGAATAMITCASIDPAASARWRTVVQLDVGPELVTGSTRLKSGTATKMVLNIITTAAMIRIGKTWGNLMVDLQARNLKLHDRGERIVMEVAGVTRAEARRAIDAAEGSIRTAIAMVVLSVDIATAREMLMAADGRLRKVIGDPPPIAGER